MSSSHSPKDSKSIPFANQSDSYKTGVNIKTFERDLRNYMECRSFGVKWNNALNRYQLIKQYERFQGRSLSIPAANGETPFVIVKRKSGNNQLRTFSNGSHYYLAISRDNIPDEEVKDQVLKALEAKKTIVEIIPPDELNVLVSGSFVFKEGEISISDSGRFFKKIWPLG